MDPHNIFIYGVPGVGKTQYSKMISKQLGFSVIEGDRVKWEARKGLSQKEAPFLFLGTCLAYAQFGVLNYDNAIKGLLAVRSALSLPVQTEIEKRDPCIFEAAFLDPRMLQEKGEMILLVVRDEQQHKKQFLSHPEKLLDIAGNEFKAARFVQEYLIEEAQELGIQIIENTSLLQ